MASETRFKETEIGLIPEDWEVRRLTDLLSYTVDNRGKSAPTSDFGIPLIATNCIKEDGLYPTKEKIRYVSEETYNNWFRDHPQPDDIIIVNKGTPGQVCLVPDPVDFCIAQDMIAIRPDTEKINGKYLFAYMRSKYFKHQVDTLNVGTTIPHLKKTVFNKLLIPTPKNEEQVGIGNSYYNISKKIDLNYQMNKTLEQIAQALFKRWFIDFEFPDEKGNPYKSNGGRMVDSELGEIPEGWGIGKLGDISGEKRKNIKVEDINPETPYFGLEHIPRKSISLSDWGNASEISSNKLTFEKYDILFGKIRPYFHKVGVAPIEGVCSTDIIVISPEEDYYSFVLSIVSSEKFVEFATQTSEGTKMPRANWRTLVKYPVVIPDKLTSKRYDEIVLAFVEIIQKNIFECKNLSRIRGSLLPKLMSGKIRVQI